MTPETSKPLGEMEYDEWPVPTRTKIRINGAVYTVVKAPAEWPKASIRIGGKLPESLPDKVYVLSAS